MYGTASLSPGDAFASLRLERELGCGSFGRVWLAHDIRLGRPVALKVVDTRGLGPATPEERQRFLREARIVAGFSHPHIVMLYHLHAAADGSYALEMEYMEGGSLEDRLATEVRFPAEQAVEIVRDVAAALAAAHAAGVIHGDVKPGNILRTQAGHIKLADFGLARLLNVQDATESMRTLAGTPRYLAPEVIGGEAPQPASDVWSAGVVLYRLLTGRLPFPHTNLSALFLAIQNEAPPPLGPEFPEALARIVERCLAKRPADRFANGDELLRALERRAEPGAAPAASPAPRPLEGRAAEVARLRAALDRVRDGGSAIVLTGPAGVGKSALALDASAEARRRGWRVAAATVTPIHGLLRPLFRAAAPEADDAWAEEPNPHGLERALSALSERSPLVVVLEDLHNAGEEEVRNLARVFRRLARRPVLWLLTERTLEVGVSGSQRLHTESLLGAEGVERLDIAPLSPEAICRLLIEAVEGDRVSGRVLDRLVRRSEGNPLFALQLLRHMTESGEVVRNEGEWVVGDSLAASAAPPGLRALVAGRLEGLPERLRSLLDVAAVDGLEFEGEAVAALLGRPLLDVLRQLQSLYRVQGLVVPRERGYRFAHPLLQEIIYAEVGPDLRRVLHRALAEHLEARGKGVDPERLGVHWERSDEPARAVPHLLRAALGAAQRQENFRCVDLVTRAGIVPGSVGAPIDAGDVEPLLQAANSFAEVGRQAEQELLYSDLLRVAEETADSALRLRVHARRGLTRYLGKGLGPGDEEDVRAAAERLPDGVDRGIAFYVLGLVERARGHLDLAETHFLAADERFVRHGAQARHGSVLDQRGTLAMNAGRFRRAAELYVEAARVCRETGRLANAAISEANAIVAEMALGAVDGQAERLESAAQVLDIDGLPGAAARVRIVLAQVRFALGDLRGAYGIVRAALDLLRKIDMLPGLVEAHTAASYYGGALGDLDAARAELAAATAAAEKQGPSAPSLLSVSAIEAIFAARAGDTLASESAGRRAIEDAGNVERSRLEAAAYLAEAALSGMPVAVLRDARALLPPEGAAVEQNATLRSTHAWIEGILALSDPAADPRDLDAHAATLDRPDAGMKRALLRAVASLLRAEAARRRGDAAEATRLLARAAEIAERMGYRWTPPWFTVC